MPTDPLKKFSAQTLTLSQGGELPYRLLKPAPHRAEKNFPLLLFLHGAGERGSENERQLIHGGSIFASDEFETRYGAIVVAPQCPLDQKWVDTDWKLDAHNMPEHPSEPMSAVVTLIDQLANELPVDANRIYVAGLSMGGFGTWDLLQRYPRKFAAAAPVCGGGDPQHVKKFTHVPIWAFHGDADPTVKVERSDAMVAALRAAGAAPIYTRYEGVAHNSWSQTFENRLLWDWMFAQKLGRS